MNDRIALDAAKASLPDYLRSLGIDPRKNFNCMFHPDKNPSMHLMPDDRHVHCFSCGKNWDLVDVIAQVEGVDTATAIARALEFAGIAPPSKPKPKARGKSVDLGSIHRHIARSIQDAGDPRLTEFLVSRGFTVEDIKIIVPQYHLGFDKIHKTLVIPHGRDYYTARRIDACPKEERFRYNATAPVQLFNADAIRADVFAVTEGAIDAFSLIVCGMPAVALGGAGTHGKLLDAVKRLDAPARILIALDNDESGRKAAAELAVKLEKAGMIVQRMLPAEAYHDFNDFLKGDRAGLKATVDAARTAILSEEEPPKPTPPKKADADSPKPKRKSKADASPPSPLILPSGCIVQFPYLPRLDGLYVQTEKKDKTLYWAQISHTAIVIDSIIENVDDGTMKASIGFYAPLRGWCKTPALDLAVLRSATKLVDASRYGPDIRSTKARYIVDYLAHFEAVNAERIPRILTVNRPGWQADGTFVYPNSEGAKYQLDVSDGNRFASKIFEQKGDVAAVIAKMEELQHKTPIAWVLFGAVLAAPLVKILNQQNLAIHIYGNTGCGKSSLTKAAISLNINPDAEGAMPTANATKVGLEILFASMYDFAVVVEDIDSISDEVTRRVILELPYQFANKVGRLRGKKEGGLQKLYEFRGVLITNGERPITDDSSKGGGKRRVLELKVPDDMLGKQDARQLHQFLRGNYGLIGRSWIQLVSDYKDRDDDMLQFLFHAFDSRLLAKYESKIPLHIDGIALVATANFIFHKALRGEEPSRDVDSDASFVQSLQTACTILEMLPDEHEIADWQRAAKYVRDWIDVHKKYFNQNQVVTAKSPYEEYGEWNSSGGYLSIVPSKLKEILTQGGYSADSIIRQFADHGFLQRHNRKRLTWAVRSNLTGISTNMYRIPFSELNEPNTPSDDEAESEEAENAATLAPSTAPVTETPAPLPDEYIPPPDDDDYPF